VSDIVVQKSVLSRRVMAEAYPIVKTKKSEN
jgi:hypothetical protein